jgi:16S rRNA (cytidine1402-2'-O)-methyltransferase
MPGKLSIVATPIGNLEDVTLRALKTLKECDEIACEDTRVTGKLMSLLEMKKPLSSLHEHSTDSAILRILKSIREGSHIVYVCDAGTPGVNDPGGKLVQAAFEAGIPVEPIPGVSAMTTAISVCGFPMDDFVYSGFVPHKKGRETFFAEVSERKVCTIFFESTHRIDKCIESLKKHLDPTRNIFVGRELTKMHETLYRGTAETVQVALKATSTKGEFVLIVGPKPKR